MLINCDIIIMFSHFHEQYITPTTSYYGNNVHQESISEQCCLSNVTGINVILSYL